MSLFTKYEQCRLKHIFFGFVQNQNQNSLLVKHQNDNTSPGLGRGRLVPSSQKGSEFRYAVVRQVSRGDERIWEVIPVPDGLGKEAFLIGIFTSRESERSLSVDFCNACFLG